jgi:phosphatidylinositol alpha-1,6-mannosyltransferase
MLARHMTRRYLRGAEEAVCISEYTAGLLQRVAPGMRSDCVVYPSVSELVLTHRADPAFGARLRHRLQQAGGPPPTVVLTVARISDRKNQLGVLQALARLRADTPFGFHYLIVGNVDAEGHRGYYDDLTAFIHANGLERTVSFIPNATDEEKVNYLDACDIFVMLSRSVGTSVEGFGISAIEASCRGKPVLVSDQGGMPETIIPGRTGVAVSPDATDAIARVLAEWAADPALRSNMGSAGRAYSRAEFTPRATAARLLEHLEHQGANATSDR